MTSRTYIDLVRKFPVRRIRNDEEHEEALAILDGLVGFEGLTQGQKDYMGALAVFVEQYEKKHFPIDTSDITPLAVLQYLVEQSGMSASEFGRRVLGRRELGVKVLNGTRCLSKSHIARIADYFKVNARLFLEEAVAAGTRAETA